MNAFLPVSTLYSLSEENISLFLLVGATFPDIPGTAEAFQVFCDRRAAAGVSYSNTKSLGCPHSVLKTGSKCLAGIIKVLKGYIPVVRKCALLLDGMAALSHASVKILSNLCLVGVNLCCGIKQQNLFIPIMIKWYKHRFFYRLHFTGSLTSKEE